MKANIVKIKALTPGQIVCYPNDTICARVIRKVSSASGKIPAIYEVERAGRRFNSYRNQLAVCVAGRFLLGAHSADGSEPAFTPRFQ